MINRPERPAIRSGRSSTIAVNTCRWSIIRGPQAHAIGSAAGTQARRMPRSQNSHQGQAQQPPPSGTCTAGTSATRRQTASVAARTCVGVPPRHQPPRTSQKGVDVRPHKRISQTDHQHPSSCPQRGVT
jgi:hypothetical protein